MRERQQEYIARSQSGHEGGGGGLADVTPAVEQPHCNARARALTSTLTIAFLGYLLQSVQPTLG